MSELRSWSAATRSGAPRRASRLTLVVVGVLFFASTALAQQHRIWIPPEPTLLERAVMVAVHVGIYFWVFVLGSVIGSYLNVVAYRLPRGKPLFWPPSSCPSCGNRIAIRDNIPVLGWILLEGKCRNCRQPISKRYPIVEAIVGGLFLLLALVELFTDGANLPFRDFNRDWGLMTTVLFPRAELIAQYLFHAVWISTLVAIVLIDLDGQPQPAKKIVGWMGTIAVASVAVMPSLLPVKLVQTNWANERMEAVATSLVGLAAGLLFGRLRDRNFDSPIAMVLAMTGAFCGWQAMIAAFLVGMIAAIFGVIAWQILVGAFKKSNAEWPFPPVSLWISAAAFVHLLIWRQWTNVPQLPGPETPWWAWLIYLAIGLKP